MEPIKKFTGCEWVGPDFVKLEGSDTCVRVGGSVRAEVGTSTARPTLFPTAPDR